MKSVNAAHPHIVVNHAANMPSSVKARYRKIAVLRLTAEGLARLATDGPWDPPIRSNRFVQVCSVWDKRHEGSTNRCASARAEDEAYEYADQLDRQYHAKLLAAVNAVIAGREPEEL